MANVLAPYGFLHIGYLDGQAPTFAPAVRKIASGNATKIFRGDPVTSLGTGYIAQASAGTTQINGIFDSCTYLSLSQGRQVYSQYWPGSDANGDVTAYVINSPNALFQAQALLTSIAFADIDANINFNIGTGSTTTGISAATLDQSTIATTNTLPFRIYGLFNGIGNGSDLTTNYDYAVVAFNNQDYKAVLGIV